MEGDPKFEASQRIPNVPYHKFAELIGLKGICVDDPDRVGAAWDEALAADRPVVVEFKTDPEVPPLPPHITLKQAKGFASALLKGDPTEGGVIVGTARQVLASVLPRQGQMSRAEAPIGRVTRVGLSRSRPTRPRPTARSNGTARRSWWSRSKPAARPASATPIAMRRSPR